MSQRRIYGMTFVALIIAGLAFVVVGILGQLIWYLLLFKFEIVKNPIFAYALAAIIGLPFLPETPWEYTFFNFAIWGIWAALGYAFIMRKGMAGRVRLKRLAILYFWTVSMAYILVSYARAHIMDINTAQYCILVIWFFTGLFIVRDWVVRP